MTITERDVEKNNNCNLNKILISKLKKWIINSDIRVKSGKDKGGMYGWKDLNAVDHSDKFPFIYNEIVGYSLSCYSFLYKHTNEDNYLSAAHDAFLYLENEIKNNSSRCKYLLSAGKRSKKDFLAKGIMEDQFYAFDNGMIISGLINYYNISNNNDCLDTAVKMANSLIDNFFVEDTIKHSLLTARMNPFPHHNEKWSHSVGPYLSKLAIGYYNLSQITNDNRYLETGNSLCEFALEMQTSDGRILNNSKSDNTVFLHPHLYACEGLLLFGKLCNDNHYLNAGLKGIDWAISQITPNGRVPRSTADSREQADCTAQLLRLLTIFSNDLQHCHEFSEKMIINLMNTIFQGLRGFFIEPEGAFRYDLTSNFACTWCNMFGLQALIFFDEHMNNIETNSENQNKGVIKKVQYFI